MRKIYLTTLFIIFLAVIFTSQLFYDQSRARARYIEPHLFSADTIKTADLGLHNAAGDLFWLAAIQYFGGNESKTYEMLGQYLTLASDLNPKFPYPYAFGALVLPSVSQTDTAISLAKRGIEYSAPDWRIPYYLATTEYFVKNDQAEALKYFDIAANTAGAPDSIKKIAANFATRGGAREKSKQIWTGIYETTKDDTVKERAAAYIAHYELMDFLEEAAAQYYKKYGRYPATPSDLVSGNILRAVPPDPFGIEFKFDQSGKLEMQ